MNNNLIKLLLGCMVLFQSLFLNISSIIHTLNNETGLAQDNIPVASAQSCGDCNFRYILIAVDRTGSMGLNDKLNDIKQKLNEFLDQFQTGSVSLSFYSFTDDVQTADLVDRTLNISEIRSAINAMSPIGLTDYGPAMSQGELQLTKVHPLGPNGGYGCTTFIVLGDGESVQGPSQAQVIKDLGFTIDVVSYPPAGPVLSQIASTGHLYGSLTGISVNSGFANISSVIDNSFGTCNHALCGDNVLEGAEQCDDGNFQNGDGCNAYCEMEYCGDGIIQSPNGSGNVEYCDDGNTNNVDGCSNSCILNASCGDGMVQFGEQCDDGNTSNGDLCASNCTFPLCGNGVVDAGEQCDWKTNSSCNGTCQYVAICGDARVSDGEFCELGQYCAFTDSGYASYFGAGGSTGRLGIAGNNCGTTNVSPLGYKYRCSKEQKGCNTSSDCDAGLESVCLTDVDVYSTYGGFWVGTTLGRCDYGGVLHDIHMCTMDAHCSVGGVCNKNMDSWVIRNDYGYCIGTGIATNYLFAPCLSDGSGLNYSGSLFSCEGLGGLCYRTLSNTLILGSNGVITNHATGNCTNCSWYSGTQCGDGVVNGYEQCDNGPSNSNTLPNGCRVDCRTAFCGDGVMDTGEQCDDGNFRNLDGCSTSCVLEYCGDGKIQIGEQCDDGGAPGGCTDLCKMPIVGTGNVCGDGLVGSGEQCDDGKHCVNGASCTTSADCGLTGFNNAGCSLVGVCTNRISTGTCTSTNTAACYVGQMGACGVNTAKPGVSCLQGGNGDRNGHIYYCGDPNAYCNPTVSGSPLVRRCVGGKNNGLACQGTNDNDRSYYCKVGVTPTALNMMTVCPSGTAQSTGSCSVTTRPNGICESGSGETAGNCSDCNTGAACEQRNSDNCNNTCTIQDRCGDGIIGLNEGCDDGNVLGGDGCSATCSLECGNGVINSGEACDDGNLFDFDLCTSQCQSPSCGDGFLNLGEQCDDGNSNDNDVCKNNCTFNAICGDGIIEGVEDCDDGNVTNWDGCSSSCALEFGPPPITGACNTTITNQTYYTGNLPTTGDLCVAGNLTNLTQTTTGWSWSCAGANGGSTQNSCELMISYCGDGILGTGVGYANEEQCEPSLQGSACNASCQLTTPVCNDLVASATTLFPGGSTTLNGSGSDRASGILSMNGDQVALGNPVTFGTSLNTLGTYIFSYVLSNPYSGALVSSTCTAVVSVVATPITGACNTTITNQTYYTGNLPTTGDLCVAGSLTNLTQTTTGWSWSCAGANGGSTQNSCELMISYCGDGILGTGVGYANEEQCEPSLQGSACNASCQLTTPVCNDLVASATTLFPGGSTTLNGSGSDRASGILSMNGDQVALGNPVTFGTSLNTLGTYIFSYVLSNPYSGALVSSTCTAVVSVVATPITGACNTTITNQTYYTGNLPTTGDLCVAGSLTNLTQTTTGWSWSCAGANGGSTQNSCELMISYCGDGILGTGVGYANEEQCEPSLQGSACNASCQLTTPVCNDLVASATTLFPGGSTTLNGSGSDRASGILSMNGDQVALGNPVTFGTSLNTLGTYIFSYVLSNPYSGALVSSTCTAVVSVVATPITGACNTTITNQTYYTGNLPTTGDLCVAGSLTNLTQTTTGWSWSCAGANGGSTQNSCELMISYCGDGILGTGVGYPGSGMLEQCDNGMANSSTGACSLTCQLQTAGICGSKYNGKKVTTLRSTTKGLCDLGTVVGFTTTINPDLSKTFSWSCSNGGVSSPACSASTQTANCSYPGCPDYYDLSINKEIVSSGPYIFGSLVTYRLHFLNSGNSVAIDSLIEDILPLGQMLTGSINYNTGDNFTGFIQNGQTLSRIVESLDANQSGWIEYSVIINTGASLPSVNTVIIVPDPTTAQPEIVPYTTGMCNTGMNPLSGNYAVSGTNNVDCEQVNIEYCGDGITNGSEQCDLASSNGTGSTCSENCTWNIPSCSSLLTVTPDNGYAPLTVSINITGAAGRASGSLNYGFGSFDITHPNYSTSVQYLTAAAYNVMYTITNPNNGSGETCTIVVNVSNAPVDGSCGPMGTGAGSVIYDFDNNGDALTGGSLGLCATGMVSGFSYDSTLHTRSWVCEGQYGGANPNCSAAELYCGNMTSGSNEPGEMCDEGLMTTQSCYGRSDLPAGQTACMPTVCGDGIPQNLNGAGLGGLTNIGDEQCDMGSSNSDTTPDACRVNCTMPTCGDGIADPRGNDGIAGTSDDEECDMGSANSLTGSCSPTCKLTYCGDSTIQQPNGNTGTQPNFVEGCDDGMSGSAACYGPADPNTPLGKACTLTTCGDGLVQTNNGEASDGATNVGDEQCDDMNTNEFDGCTASCVIQLCEINGYVYGDIANNNLFDPLSDISIDGQTITLTGATGMWTTTTDSDGFYSFTDLDCQDTYTVSFTNSSIYKEDSAQLEQTTQQSLTNTIVVSPSLFQDTANLYSSPDNNFGLVQYDLSIAKTFVSNMGLDGVLYPLLSGALPVVESGDLVTYHITFAHSGITVANNVQVTDSYDPSHLSFVSASAVNIPLGGLLPLVNSSSAGRLTRYFSELNPGDTYTVAITMRVVGNNADLVHNDASIYSSNLTGDMIEDAFSPSDDFANNTTSVEIVVQSCAVDGYVYLDIANDNIFNGSDVAQVNQAITCNGGQHQAIRMDTTDTAGYYSCEPMSCRYPVTVSYIESTPYLADSAQHEMNNQQITATSIVVPVTAFTDGYKSELWSEDNNFGVTLYNLAIKKELLRQQSQQRGGSPIPVKYQLTITNEGPTTAYDAVISDVFDNTLLSITASSVTMSGPSAAIPTTLPLASVLGNTMTLAPLPVLLAGETVVVNYDGNIIGFNGSPAVNTGSIYVGVPETDPLENEVFVDNEDKAEVITKLPGASSPYVPTTPDIQPDPIENPVSQTIEVVQNIIKKVLTDVKDMIFEEEVHSVAPDQLPATGAR